jgi:uncharacterized protein (DUF2141 family)
MMPSGGPRDTTPPKVVAEKPENGSVNFNGNTIKITFDEFVTLNNPVENVIFSPPLNERVEYSTKGKSVVVKMRDTLRANTTYNLLFSDCIQDFHEGNKLNSYDFAFSTGDSIDLHTLFGIAVNAVTNEPEKGFFVMLYENDTDSLPLTIRPNYITKTDDKGKFIFKHLKPVHYKLFALKDINSNFIYDLPSEQIAFADSMFLAKFYATDSLLKADTDAQIILKTFQDEDTVQLLYPFVNSQRGIYHFPFKKPVNSFDIQIKSSIDVDFFSKISETRDTITMYLKRFFQDSAIVYIQTDDLRMDTMEILPFKISQGGKNKKVVASILTINISNKEHLYYPTLLNFSYPVKPADSVQMFVIAAIKGGKDTSIIHINIPDSLVMQVPIPFAFQPKINYTLMIPDSSFYGYKGATNDTVISSFSKKTEKDYGNLIIHYQVKNNNDTNYIVELLSSNKKVIQRNIVFASETIEYKHLFPGSYRIRVVEDLNKNGRWDTGNYRKRIQPEKSFIIEKEMTVRGFWEVEEEVEF